MNRVHYRAALRADTERIALLHADSWRRTYRGSYRDTFLDGDVVTNRVEAVEQPSGSREGGSVRIRRRDGFRVARFCLRLWE